MKRNFVLLYYPLLHENNDGYHWFPFSLMPLAQSLRKAGYEVRIIDRRIDDNVFPIQASEMDQVLFAGISAMSGYQIADGLKIADMVRKTLPNVPIVWGGWHSTILPEETVEHDLVDYVIAGRAEKTIVEFANAARDQSEMDIKGLAFKTEGTSKFTGYKKTEPLADDAQKYGGYIDVNKYINQTTMALGYFSGHGCAYKCSFCSRHFMTNKYTPYDIEKVIDDLKYYKTKYGYKKIYFQDDNFFNSKDRALSIATAMVREKLDMEWGANIRADVIPKMKKDELSIFFKSGLSLLQIGVESADEELLAVAHKGINSADIEITNDIIRHYDIVLKMSYILGLPGDDCDKLRKTISQINRIKSKNSNAYAYACFYQPYPGTELYEKAIECGYPRLHGLEQWATVKPQSKIGNIPWLTNGEMNQYQEEFNSCGCFTTF